MPIGMFTAGRHLPINDDQLENGEGYQDFHAIARAMGQQFTPQAIYINASSVAGEETAGYAIIDGFLIGENETFRRRWRVNTREFVHLAFQRIYNGPSTTGRGIALVSEV